jgi:hypothetical protein
MANPTTQPDISRLPIRRNVALLSTAVAANSAMLQLTAAVAAISLARVLEVEALLGPGAVVLVTIQAVWILRGGPRRHGLRFGSNDPGRRPCSSTSP